jgi:hypothetical protein
MESAIPRDKQQQSLASVDTRTRPPPYRRLQSGSTSNKMVKWFAFNGGGCRRSTQRPRHGILGARVMIYVAIDVVIARQLHRASLHVLMSKIPFVHCQDANRKLEVPCFMGAPAMDRTTERAMGRLHQMRNMGRRPDSRPVLL